MLRNPAVELAPSTMSGKVTGPSVHARARLLSDEEARHAAQVIERKHRILQGVLVPLDHRLRAYRTLHFELTPVQDAAGPPILCRLCNKESGVMEGLPIVDERQTTSHFLQDWLKASKDRLRPRTWTRYDELIRLYITPEIGSTRIARLTPQQLNNVYTKAREKGRSSSTVHQVHAVLHKALRQATAWGATARNVADFVDVPQVQRQEMKALTPEQTRKFLEAAKGTRFEVLFVLAVMTGMRQGELLGLRWQDVDLDAGCIQVRQTAQRVKGEGLVFGTPKTEKSRRRIEVSETVVAALRWHRTKQLAERLKLGAHYEDYDLVFANESGKPVEVSNLTNRYFRPLLEKAKLPRIRFHDLRHTAATLMLVARQDVKVVSEMLGHSQTAFTMDRYQHVTESMQRQASRAVEALLVGG